VSKPNDVPQKEDSPSTPPILKKSTPERKQALCQTELDDKFPVCNGIKGGGINRQMVLV
jgi:hypothetical protein